MQRHVRHQSEDFPLLLSVQLCSIPEYRSGRKTKKEKHSPKYFKQLLRTMILNASIVSEEIPRVEYLQKQIPFGSCLLAGVRLLCQPENWVPFICKSERQENEIVVSSVHQPVIHHLVSGRSGIAIFLLLLPWRPVNEFLIKPIWVPFCTTAAKFLRRSHKEDDN